MNGEHLVPIIALGALVTWSAVLVAVRDHLRHSETLPDAVREGALVAVYAACLGGLAASLGFVDLIPASVSALLATAWRSAVMACGIYALIGARRARGRR